MSGRFSVTSFRQSADLDRIHIQYDGIDFIPPDELMKKEKA
jgi:hypothetical protein